MIDPKLVEIGKNTFGIKPMDPFTALAVLGDLQKVVLPVIGNLATVIDEKSANVDNIMEKGLDFNKIGPALSLAANNLDGQTIAKLAKKLITKELITVQFEDGTQSRMDDEAVSKAFTGNMAEMLQLIWKIVEVNYGDFFSLMPKNFGKALAAKLPKK